MSEARPRDRGAAAVEFALIVPVLLLLVLGIVAFGHAFHVQSVLSNAARDSVRVMTLQRDGDPLASARETAIASAAPSVELQASHITITPETCQTVGAVAPGTATVTIRYPMELLGTGKDITLTARGTMRCNG